MDVSDALRKDLKRLIGDPLPDREDGRFYECKVTLPGTFASELVHDGDFVTCLFFYYAGQNLSKANAQFTELKAQVFACLAETTDESSDTSKGVLRYVGFYTAEGTIEYTCSVSLESMGKDYVTLVELSRDRAE
jgi:hypothetical protein